MPVSFASDEITVDAAGNLYFVDESSWQGDRIRKISFRAIALGEDGKFALAEGDGSEHVMSSSGRHEETKDLNTGVVLRRFGYDEEGRLTSITDPRFDDRGESEQLIHHAVERGPHLSV